MAMFVRGMFYAGGLGAGYYAMSQMGQSATVAKTKDAADILTNPSEKPQMLELIEGRFKEIVDEETAEKYCDVFEYYDEIPGGQDISTYWNYAYITHGCSNYSKKEYIKKCELIKKVLEKRME